MSITYPQYSNSTFPNSIDVFQQALDILSTDLPLIDLYYQALQSGTAEQISQALANIPNGAQKIDSAQRYNQLRDAVLAIEQYVQATDGELQRTINLKEDEWNKKIAQFSYKGVYSETATYYQNNIVSTQDSGNIILYIAINVSPSGFINIPITNTNYWRLLTISASGKYLTYRNTWIATTVYSINNCVTYKSQLYLCIDDNIGHTPDAYPTEWILLVGRGNSKQYYWEPIAPPTPITGQIWFDTAPV